MPLSNHTAPPVRISTPSLTQLDAQRWRVVADVDGTAVFFESEFPISPSPEAYLCAFLLPAMALGRDLEIDAPVCGDWLTNVEAVRRFTKDAWPSYSGGHIHCKGTRKLAPAKEAGRALFFGGGVDSFCCLKEKLGELRTIIFVQYLDLLQSDHPKRLDTILSLDRAVAEECGLELLSVRTNLREHPLYHRTSWLMLYGGALAAVGHILRSYCNHIFLSGWGHVTEPYVRGSHPEMDPGWSSGAVSFEHHGEQYSRTEKVARISSWPVMHHHLRVCWRKSRGDLRLNCGCCEKCLRTQLELLSTGALSSMQVFPDGNLAERLDAAEGIEAHHMDMYRGLLDSIDEPAVVVALKRLLERSPLKEKTTWSKLLGHFRKRLRNIKVIVLGHGAY